MSRSGATRSRRAERRTPRRRRGYSTFCSTVSHGSTPWSWKTTEGRAAIVTVPRSASSRPARMRSRVLLPHPEGPSTQTNSLSSMVSDTSWSATSTSSRRRSWNPFQRPSTETAVTSRAPRPARAPARGGRRGRCSPRPPRPRTRACRGRGRTAPGRARPPSRSRPSGPAP
ncbi:Uncharacterised protein [Mycobacteroides abscessus]|nr:Uncharacterised protein [Mycobacteroides abscessus]